MSVVPIKLGFNCNQLTKDGFPIDSLQIATIAKWLSTESLPTFTSEQIVLFLVSCNYDIKGTMKTIKTYVQMKYSGHDLFSNRRLSNPDITRAYSVGTAVLYPRRSPDGDIIILYKYKNQEYWNWVIKDMAKICLMAIECGLYEYPPKGLIILIDLENLCMKHILKMRPGLLHFFFKYHQEAIPVKLKNMHIFNSSSLLNHVLAIVKPLMPKAIFDKVCFHPKGLDWNTFHENYLPKSVLNEEYGGELPSLQVLEKQTMDRFVELEEYFDVEELSRFKC